MTPYMPPVWSGRLRNFYYMLRYRRYFDSAGKRRYYRYIRRERDCLVASGVNAEHVRLLCRWLSNPAENAALRRLERLEAAMASALRFSVVAQITVQKPILPSSGFVSRLPLSHLSCP